MKMWSNNDAELKKLLHIKKCAIQYVEFNGGVHFFCFRQEIPFFPQIPSNNQNSHFKLKLGTLTNSNMKIWYLY